ncbi:MAG: phosphoribosylglycinamide formyltransferase [Saprospiraceae bacterium]
MKSLALFASGKGSNAKNIISFFKDHPSVRIALVVSSHKEAGVIEVAHQAHLPCHILDKKEYYGSGDLLMKLLTNKKIDGIVLAGFIWLIPQYLLENFPKAIINIHPALLPAYGGKGMFGFNVHEAVWSNKEKKSGISIHQVNEHYDDGEIIFQAVCDLDPKDMPTDIAQKVQQLEYTHYPKVIESYFSD